MKHYLKIEIESDNSEIIMRVEPIYCSLENSTINIKQEDYVPTKGDKLYFLPGVNIPRVKMKDLTIQYGIKSVRNIDDATHVFASRNTGPKMMDHNWMYNMPTETFRKIFEATCDHMDEYYSENVREALEYYQEDVVLFNYDTASEIRNTENETLEAAIDDVALKSAMGSHTIYRVNDDYKSYFPSILSLDIYNESKLLKYINGDDAVVIDAVMFEQLSDMFKSSDNDNHILAMEIMANCNYIDSLLYIEFLFKEYHPQMTNCHTRNHVNFKSLLSFLGKSKNYMYTTIDDIVESLINKDVFDLEKVDVIMKHYGQDIANSGGTTYFEVKSITLNEKAAKLLNTNYVHETFPDFIPEDVVVDVPELHGDLDDLNSMSGVEEVDSEVEISDEDIQDVLDSIETNTAEEEALALEDATFFSESELNDTQGTPEEESNNNQIEETNGRDDFEWF